MAQRFDRPFIESERSAAFGASHMAEDEEEAAARRLKALTRSNAALRCLLALQSRRKAAETSRNASGGDPVPELSEFQMLTPIGLEERQKQIKKDEWSLNFRKRKLISFKHNMLKYFSYMSISKEFLKFAFS